MNVKKVAEDSHCCNNNAYLLITCSAVLLGISVPVGYGFSSVGPLGYHIQAWSNQTLADRFDAHLSNEELSVLWSAMISIYLIGGIFSSSSGAWISDKLGRKFSLFVCGCLFLIGSICFLLCRLYNIMELLLLGRLLSGFAAGLSTCTAPMYLSEIAPLKIRGSLASLFSLGMDLGIVFGAACGLEELLGNNDKWHYSLSFHGILVIFAIVSIPFFPESPKYLYAIAKQKQKSIDVLIKLRGSNFKLIDEELKLMEKETSFESNKRTMISVLIDPLLRLPLILTCFIQIGQQLSGIGAICYYTVPLFESIGMSSVNAKWANFCVSVFLLLFSIPSPFVMATFNRRPVLITSCFCCAVSLALMTIVVTYVDEFGWAQIMALIATFAFLISYQIGLASIPYFIGAELFEVTSRPAAMAIGSIISWIFNFAAAMSHPSIFSAIGACVFLPYLCVVLGLGIFLIFYLPETRNYDPTEIAPKMCKGFRSKPLK